MQTGSNHIGRPGSKRKTSHTRDGAVSLAGSESETTIEHGLAMLKE